MGRGGDWHFSAEIVLTTETNNIQTVKLGFIKHPLYSSVLEPTDSILFEETTLY